jgi:2-amino-4-hydroxy-6-hydroxymethyldihydropteridine diphosphokinase
MAEAVISLGANLGDRLAALAAARDALARLPETRLAACAPIYETEPVEVPAECRHLAFFNTVVVLETGLDPEALAAAAFAIEAGMGRKRGAARNAPRLIDIDLIAHGDAVRRTPSLQLPHPRALSRRFVCRPLADVRPALVLPGETRSVAEALAALPPRPAVRLAAVQWPSSPPLNTCPARPPAPA